MRWGACSASSRSTRPSHGYVRHTAAVITAPRNLRILSTRSSNPSTSTHSNYVISSTNADAPSMHTTKTISTTEPIIAPQVRACARALVANRPRCRGVKGRPTPSSLGSTCGSPTRGCGPSSRSDGSSGSRSPSARAAGTTSSSRSSETTGPSRGSTRARRRPGHDAGRSSTA